MCLHFLICEEAIILLACWLLWGLNEVRWGVTELSLTVMNKIYVILIIIFKKICVSHMSKKSEEWWIESSGMWNWLWKLFNFVPCGVGLICCYITVPCILSELSCSLEWNEVEHLRNRILSRFVMKKFLYLLAFHMLLTSRQKEWQC